MPVDRILCQSKLENTFLVVRNTISKELLKNLSSSEKQQSIKRLSKIYTKKPTISVSKMAMLDFCNTFSHCKLKPTNYIYNPVNVAQINQHAQSITTLKVSNYIIHVGKFNIAKRHDILIKAYHKSAVKNHLVLLGQGVLKEKIKKLVQSLQLSDKVIFAGFYKKPYPLIKNAKLMILSSDFEGLAIVILEALVLGVPVISTNCPSGTSEILASKNLCNTGDIDALSQLIKKAINNSAEYKQPLNKQFTLDYATKKYLKLVNTNNQK